MTDTEMDCSEYVTGLIHSKCIHLGEKTSCSWTDLNNVINVAVLEVVISDYHNKIILKEKSNIIYILRIVAINYRLQVS